MSTKSPLLGKIRHFSVEGMDKNTAQKIHSNMPFQAPSQTSSLVQRVPHSHTLPFAPNQAFWISSASHRILVRFATAATPTKVHR